MSGSQQGHQSTDISRNAFALLARYRIEPTPVNFEVIYEIVSGNNPELRRRFLELGRNVTREALADLARTYLPHHFGESVYDRSQGQLRGELADFRNALNDNRSSLSSFRETLTGAAERLAGVRDPGLGALSGEIADVARAAAEQELRAARTIEQVDRQLDKVEAMNREIEASERAKFLHVATGLGNRRAFNRSLADIYRNEARGADVTLVLGRVANFSAFGASHLIKAKEMLMASFGTFALKTIAPGDQAFWLDSPEMAFILETVREDEVNPVLERLRGHFTIQFRALGLSPAITEKLFICFGAASSRSARTAGALIGHAETALETAMVAGESRTVFHVFLDSVEAKSGQARDYALYGRRDIRL